MAARALVTYPSWDVVNQAVRDGVWPVGQVTLTLVTATEHLQGERERVPWSVCGGVERFGKNNLKKIMFIYIKWQCSN